MLKKIFLIVAFTAVSLFAINFQTASKEQLMTIKGIGEKRAEAIIKYRKKNKIRSASDLENIPGIGKEIANNAKRGIKNSDSKKSVKKSTSSSTKTKSTKQKEKSQKKRVTKERSQKKKSGDKTKRAEKKAQAKKKKEKSKN